MNEELKKYVKDNWHGQIFVSVGLDPLVYDLSPNFSYLFIIENKPIDLEQLKYFSNIFFLKGSPINFVETFRQIDYLSITQNKPIRQIIQSYSELLLEHSQILCRDCQFTNQFEVINIYDKDSKDPHVLLQKIKKEEYV